MAIKNGRLIENKENPTHIYVYAGTYGLEEFFMLLCYMLFTVLSGMVFIVGHYKGSSVISLGGITLIMIYKIGLLYESKLFESK